MQRLKRRADFLRLATGARAVTPGLILQMAACPKDKSINESGELRVGITASRRVGGAVARNRARRRLRPTGASSCAARDTPC